MIKITDRSQYEPEYYTVDLTEVKTDRALHETLHRSLDFREPCGNNWNAFWDFLIEMSGVPLYIEVRGLESLQRRFPEDTEVLLDCLKDLKHYDHDRYIDMTHIVLVTGDVRTEIR